MIDVLLTKEEMNAIVDRFWDDTAEPIYGISVRALIAKAAQLKLLDKFKDEAILYDFIPDYYLISKDFLSALEKLLREG